MQRKKVKCKVQKSLRQCSLNKFVTRFLKKVNSTISKIKFYPIFMKKSNSEWRFDLNNKVNYDNFSKKINGIVQNSEIIS
jgi:hypothetical protein